MIYSENLLFDIPETGACAALGNFDGLHIGHRAVIETAVSSGLFSIVISFRENPRILLGSPPPNLLTHEIKLRLLEEMGADALVELDFASVRGLSPEQFFDALTDSLKLRHAVCGYNYHFGKNGAGDAKTLCRLGKQRGVGCTVLPPVTCGGDEVSATAIRGLLQNGGLEKATAMLGRPFSYDFPVVRGAGRGHAFGFPTINQHFPDGFVLPAFGVYASRTLVGGVSYPSVTNIGVRPTYRSAAPLSETHIHNFSADLYGQRIEVGLLKYLRGEIAFSSPEMLIAQMEEDSAKSRLISDEIAES